MVSQGNLAHALSLFSANAAAPFKSDQDVGPLVLYQFCVCGAVRRGSRLFLRLAGVSLSRVRIFLFNWITPGGRTLDSGALHLRFRPGNLQLLRSNQSCCAKHGLSQRAPRFAINPVEQPAKTARDGAGILQPSKISFLVEQVAISVRF